MAFLWRQAVKKIASNNQDAAGKPDRYRLHLSDGTYKQPSAMLATQLNEYVTDGRIDRNCIVRVTKYICNTVSGRRIIIILGLEVLATVAEQIGSPELVKEDDEGAAAQAAPAQAAPEPVHQSHYNAAPAPAPAARAAPAPAYSNPFVLGRVAANVGCWGFFGWCSRDMSFRPSRRAIATRPPRKARPPTWPPPATWANARPAFRFK